jgi:hypothetical protein
MNSDTTNEHPQGKKKAESLMERVAILEEKRNSMEIFMERVERTLWITETVEAVLATIGGPLRKGVEMAIAAAIIYLVTRIRIAL